MERKRRRKEGREEGVPCQKKEEHQQEYARRFFKNREIHRKSSGWSVLYNNRIDAPPGFRDGAETIIALVRSHRSLTVIIIFLFLERVGEEER